jgi:bacterial/archaeal transporter family-2 protein
MLIALLVLALLSGAALAVQAAINAQLRVALGTPVLAALASFVVGTVALAGYALVARAARPDVSAVSAAPWWVWTGGVIGAVYVTLTVILVPRLGPALLFGTIVAGQMLAALALDHYGLLGVPTHPVNTGRLVGAVLLIAGVVLIRRF